MKDLKVEILATGNWTDMHGTKFSVNADKLNQIASNFKSLKDVIDVVLKLGHNDEQPLTDGQPLLGHISDVWVENNKLFGMFTDMPKILYNAIKKKLYNNVSIEALLDVSHKGVDYGTVLTAVSLLGMDMPAVNTLSDLQTYMTKGELAFSGHLSFSKQPLNSNHSKESTMTPEEQAEFDNMKAQIKAKDKVIADNATETVKFTKDATVKDAEITKLKDDGKKAEFTAAKETVEADLESLVKDNKITPAQRDKLTKDLDADNIGNVQFTINTLKENTKADGKKTQGREDKSEGNDDNDLSAADQVSAKATEFAADKKVSFSVAVNHVLKTNPKLAREYADSNDKED